MMIETSRQNSGFTLVELLVVIAIIGLLGFLGMTVLTGARQDSEVMEAQAFITTVSASLDQYRNQRDIGVYPPTNLADYGDVGKLANKTNLGIETLYVALNSAKFKGETLEEKQLAEMMNLDEDFSKKPLTANPVRDLFEPIDPWGNPYAYFNAIDYDNKDVQQYVDVNGDIVTVKPWTNPRTKGHYNRNKFQLFSAGPDGQFNTEDDIGNWKQP